MPEFAKQGVRAGQVVPFVAENYEDEGRSSYGKRICCRNGSEKVGKGGHSNRPGGGKEATLPDDCAHSSLPYKREQTWKVKRGGGGNLCE